jgi:hypothetical protein
MFNVNFNEGYLPLLLKIDFANLFFYSSYNNYENGMYY